ncbi:MAG: S8 family serine peptidase [Verrucomicrobia bacterium]|nr:S8 family serine peptidase [Verrucomicrobiota bacterium]
MASARAVWVAICLGGAALQAADNSPWLQIGKAEVHPTRILARFEPSRSLGDAEVAPLLAELGLSVRREYKLVPGLVVFDEASSALRPQAVVVPVDPARRLRERIARLRDSGLFLYVEPSPVLRPTRDPNDARYLDGTLWGLRNIGVLGGIVGADINARQAWDITTGSTNVIVAVNDTGIRYTHQDLAAQMWRNSGEIAGDGEDNDGNGYVDDVFGANILDDTGDPMDFDDHGTHVAGTIGAAANNGHPHVGVAWQVQLMGVRWLSSLGGSTDDSIAALEYAAANGARIVNGSYGGYLFSQAKYDSILAAMGRGVLFVAAAANDGIDNDGDFSAYPASYNLENIIAVAALDRADNLASFSNYGLGSVDLGAPGVEIFSSVSTANNAFSVFQGTSMAAPHVAGVAALILAQYPDATITEMRERLLRTVVPVNSLAGLTVTGGRVDAYKALSATPDGEMEIVVTPRSGSTLLAGQQQQIDVEVTDLFSVTDATVTGLIDALGINLTFSAGAGIYVATLDVPTDVSSISLEITVQAPGKTTQIVTVVYAVQPPPPNDDFVNAIKIPAAGGRPTSNNQLATIETGEPMHADVITVAGTLWWTWSPSVANRALVDTSGSDFDTVVAVYTGSRIDELVEIAAADDIDAHRQAYVTFDAVAGETYRIVVGGADDAQRGSLRLRVQPNGLPDVTAPLVVFTTPSGLITTEPSLIVKGAASDPEPDSSGIRQVSIRVNNELTGRTAQGTTEWMAPVQLNVGDNVIRAVALDGAGNQGATRQITVTYMPQDPANDHFANAQLLTGTAGTALWSSLRATKEFGEPLHAGNAGGSSVWGRWTAPEDGVLMLNTAGSAFDTLLGVYTGERVNELTTVASNDDNASTGATSSQVTFGVRSNVTYHIAVDGYAGVQGQVTLQYDFTSGPFYRITLEAGDGGTVSPGTGDYPGGVPLVLTATADPGFLFEAWTGDIETASNPLSVVPSQDLTLKATFARRPFTDDFETGGFKPSLNYNFNPMGSVAAWQVQAELAALGKYAARAGATGHGQQSGLQLTEVLDAGIGSFSLKVSSEASWDGLEFYLNGLRLQRWSGQVDWLTFEFSVPAGTNTLEWRYVKDFTLNAGMDTALIDNLLLPLATAEAGAPELKLSYFSQSAQLELRGLPDRAYYLQASPNLRDWQTISTNVAVGGVVRITDPTIGQGPARYYRAIKP